MVSILVKKDAESDVQHSRARDEYIIAHKFYPTSGLDNSRNILRFLILKNMSED
jgi:hypothetical protein